ncbi:ABSCISIC ACID-INSENSITIVE 5-like protein 2 [Morella rubra]|uniref:ABSCISIC ACID-INSENSITIVE 5-like protein 2 n=1 Tax=Morella rubra TaxID=262757 RepID=A0A6A1WD38_9ROSI|nr:ABSCISIC ACID-INSENSITIVE 5-like protein 2 [Morella rubra]
MGSQGGGGGGGGSSAVQMPKSHSLARQGSLYSLTLDEVETQISDFGKPLRSMSMEELLKTVCIAEGSQVTEIVSDNVSWTRALALHGQGSLTISSDFSKKTVNEVWRHIQRKKNKSSDQERYKAQDRRPTFGEMTLEDFLENAGVVTESSSKGNADGILGIKSIATPQHSNIMQHGHWMQFQSSSVQQPQQHQQQNGMAGFMPGVHLLAQESLPVLDAACPDTHMTMSPSSLIGALSDTQTPGRKRTATGIVGEKTVERRQKRMIKNRESAARSRARRQAYTHELENKVSRLEEENDRLKRQKKKKELKKEMLYSRVLPNGMENLFSNFWQYSQV